MADTHSVLMNRVYRRQRFVYDATRKYYLLGRDYALDQLQPPADAHILEVACGTGRNLDQIDARYPGRNLYGLDISSEMLRSARAKLGDRAMLAQGDACDLDPSKLFGCAKFDRILMSYCISMMPLWQSAIREAVSHLSPCGELHIVDFGDQSQMPHWFDKRLRNWLGRFHVTPRDNLAMALCDMVEFNVTHKPLMHSYAQYACVRNREDARAP
ncbi:class I SAM-dependent methyltransferase [Ruegeria sp. 2205SS24-7]|uniref:class I SAM-dependent methyltransferase n=1 Tax=Ruegeria discodermiae TaxID=3064389 RepID=UPI0027428C89|nr:class I SAM-dependent methyltransferase [Ruegeria sp. 2205SS24-7]MDP5220419.1 class I SAM-dependent methyltransferase [Ruegeria sp. 2205SS24-7]